MAKQRTDKELRTAAGHVDYEIAMLKAMTSCLQQPYSNTLEDRLDRNACLESFVLHVRNLIDFLYPPLNVKPDDVLADHFVSDIALWERVRPAKTPLLKDAEVRVNKLAAPVTHARIDMPRNWRFQGIYSDPWKVLRCFGQQLAPGRQAWLPNLR